jgi:pyrophosphatase PpaX
MHPYAAVLFDIDGTVQDTTEYIYQALEHSLALNGFPAVERSSMHALIGLPLGEVYTKLTGATDVLKLKHDHEQFQVTNTQLVKNFQEIEEVLMHLKSAEIKIAAVSSRKTESLKSTLAHTGILEYFDTVVGPYDTPHHKPHPAPVHLALERLGVTPDNAIMIGDSYIDIETGINAGTDTMRVAWGFHQEKMEDPEPTYIVHSISEILEILL